LISSPEGVPILSLRLARAAAPLLATALFLAGPAASWPAASARAAAADVANPSRTAGITVAAPTTAGNSIGVGNQTFELHGLPGDAAWQASLATNLPILVPALQELTGLEMPGGTVVVTEVAYTFNDAGIHFDPATATLDIPQSASPGQIAHALSHIWFNSSLFADTWVNEGLATYSERAAGDGNYTPCTNTPAYPGTREPDLTAWQSLDVNATIAAQNLYDWQYAASCAFFSTVAESMGSANFRAVLLAAASRAPAYVSTPTGASGKAPGPTPAPITSRYLLDLIDERGMVPAGIADLDKTQALMAAEGLFDATTLAERAAARALYHAEVGRAGSWRLPAVVLDPMESWHFAAAQTAMTSVGQVLDLRDQLSKGTPAVTLDGTVVQDAFEAATAESSLADVIDRERQTVSAAAKVAAAQKIRKTDHGFVQSIGLIGVNLDTPLGRAGKELAKVEPDLATRDAQSVIDDIDAATTVGWLRVALAVGVVGLIGLVGIWIVFLLRRRSRRRRAGVPAQ
jgi:hypothetical protein